MTTSGRNMASTMLPAHLPNKDASPNRITTQPRCPKSCRVRVMVSQPGTRHLQVMSDQSRQSSKRTFSVRCSASVYLLLEQAILAAGITAVFEDVFCPHTSALWLIIDWRGIKNLSQRVMPAHTERSSWAASLKMSMPKKSFVRCFCNLG